MNIIAESWVNEPVYPCNWCGKRVMIDGRHLADKVGNVYCTIGCRSNHEIYSKARKGKHGKS